MSTVWWNLGSSYWGHDDGDDVSDTNRVLFISTAMRYILSMVVVCVHREIPYIRRFHRIPRMKNNIYGITPAAGKNIRIIRITPLTLSQEPHSNGSNSFGHWYSPYCSSHCSIMQPPLDIQLYLLINRKRIWSSIGQMKSSKNTASWKRSF